MKANYLFLVILAAVMPRAIRSQDTDSALIRVERLVVGGDRSTARVLADSLVASLPADSPRLADVLYWRAQSATSAADAERDYLRISIEHPFTARAPDALLALAQLEFARGDRSAARRRFDRLLRDYPTGRHVARASLWSGRLALEERDNVAGCKTLNAALPQLGSDDIELRNQFDYYVTQCERITPTNSVPSSASASAPPTGKQSPTAGSAFSVQVAAYNARQDATSLAARLKQRGYDVRVVGDRAPYRVRIGRYATRADANAALARIRASRLTGIVVEAEPR
jgi:sporulation related protein